MRAAVIAACLAAALPARADDAALDRATIVYPRDGALRAADGRGKHERELAKLPADAGRVGTLQVDARGRALIAEIGGAWYWMPLTATALRTLPCSGGHAAQLAPDGTCVLCRGASGLVIVQLASGKQTPVAIRALRGWIAVDGRGARKLVWADAFGVWTAPAGDPARATKVAPEAPLRSFLPSPDGTRAVGVYADFVYERRRAKRPADVLMVFALDGQAARRKGIRDALPIAWSHDGRYVLVQDGGAACLMRAGGGQYKCWKGYTAAALAPDGSYALVFGARGLYRSKLDGPFDGTPALVARGVTGAAAWLPTAGAP